MESYKIRFTGDNKQQIDLSLTNIKNNISKHNITYDSKVWEADDGNGMFQKSIIVKGSFSDVKSLLKETQTSEGVLVEMI